MADAIWPDSLPLAPLLADYHEGFTGVTTSVTTGNKSILIRRNSSRAQNRLYVAFLFNKEQVEYFETFFFDVLNGGSERFMFEHPRTRREIECSFDPTQNEPFTITPMEGLSMTYFKMESTFLIWTF